MKVRWGNVPGGKYIRKSCVTGSKKMGGAGAIKTETMLEYFSGDLW